jgi:hypothetical protein
MRNSNRRLVISLAAFTVLVVVGCGGGGAAPEQPPRIGPAACSVLDQTGCGVGQKCTWIRITDALGATGCVPTGTRVAQATCNWGSLGETTGYDDCAKGLTCVGGGASSPGECKADCRSDTNAGCLSTEACTVYSGLYSNSTPSVGLCEATCNPLTQVRLTDGAAACGSPDLLAPTRGCFGSPSRDARPTVFSCAPIMTGSAARTHRVPAAVGGVVYLNSCAPGYLPLLLDSTGSTTVVCIALCSPVESWAGSVSQVGGAAPHTCLAAGATGAGEECRYWSFLEDYTTPIGQWSNGLGFCLDHTRYTWDADSNALTPPVPFPSCGDLANTDTNANGYLDHLEWGCGPISSR